jgi:hypothetical protein
MITTKKIQFTNKSYFKILLQINLKKYFWLFVLLWFFALINIFKSELNYFDIYIIIFSVAFPIYFFLWYWRFANTKENKIFFLERYYNIDNDKIIGFLNDGTENTIKKEHFIKFLELKESYLIYISKVQFLYFPKNAFQTVEDENWFKVTILEPIAHEGTIAQQRI